MELFATNNFHIPPFEIPKDEGYSVIWDDKLNGFFITIPHGELFYSKTFLVRK